MISNCKARKISRNFEEGGVISKRQMMTKENPTILSESCSMNTSYYGDSDEGEGKH